MHAHQVSEDIFLIDVKTAGLDKLIASYVLRAEKTIIIDCGPPSSIPNLLAGLKELCIRPEEVNYIALTHVHVDHSGGAGLLLQNLPNAKVIVHPKGAPHLIDPTKLWEASKNTLEEVAEIFGQPKMVQKDRISVGFEGMTLDVGKNRKIKIIETPGHASHNLSYYDQDNGDLFPGEAAGAYFPSFDIVLPATPPPFRPDIALSTIDKLIKLNPNSIYYPHFGKSPEAVKRLNTYAIQIKNWLEIAKDSIQKGENLHTVQERMFKEDNTIPKELREAVMIAINSNPIHKRTLFHNSIEGFLNFARKSNLQ